VLGVIYGLKRIAAHGIGWAPVLSIAAGLLLGVGFVRRQRTLVDPLIDLRLFRAPAFRAALVTYLLATFAVFGPYVFIAQYLQLVLGLSPMQAGLWSMPFAAGFVIGSMVSPVLARHIRPAALMAGGLVIAAFGFALLTQVEHNSRVGLVVTSTVLFSIGLSPVFTLANDIIIGSAPPERAGAASAISETCSEFGGALGIAILGSIGTAIYRRAMEGSALDGISPGAAEAARETLGGAVTAAAEFPDRGTALLEQARVAFTDGLQVTAAASMVIVIGMAVVVLFVLRRVRPSAPA
jgi:DHA2 family multidrug resistance protein-like MFS transporter